MNWRIFLRWLAVLPTAVLGFVLGLLIMTIFGLIQAWYIGINPDAGYYKIFNWVISPVVSGMLSVYWGTKIAPHSKKVVSSVLAGLILIIAVLLTLININYGEDGWFWPILGGLAIAFGAGYSMYNIYEQGENFSLFD